MKILVVEDSPVERVLLGSFFRRRGDAAVVVDCGEKALQAYPGLDPDLVLLDVILPGIDGHETARRLRALGGDWVPIIFLSGRASAADIAEGIAAGGDDYLAKPLDETVLAAKMHSMQRIAEMRAKLVATTRDLEHANRALARAAGIDALTNLANRRVLDETLAQEYARCARTNAPLAVILADVDHFKRYNDHNGHLAGDQCLQRVAAALNRTLHRPGDLLARYGGEEFCVVLPDTDLGGARAVAEGMRAAVERLALSAPAGGVVTASFGVSASLPRALDHPARLLAEADLALYAAKDAGRNRVLPYCAAEAAHAH
jgi:diguanylate cyclase (GGDEF)-like protein